MPINRQIILSTTLMVAFAVLITATSVFFLLNQGLETQIQELSGELKNQSYQRIQTGRKILSHQIEFQIQRNNLVVNDIRLNKTVRDVISLGQWKALFAMVAEIIKTTDIDFIIIFDSEGRVLTSSPGQMDESFPEAHFKKLDLFKSFAPAIAERNLTETSVISSFEKWDPKVLRAYNIGDNRPDGDILALSAGVIPNGYYDEPLGYIFCGITSKKLSSSFDLFFETTGQMAFWVDDKNPMVWAGVSESKNDLIKKIKALYHGLGRDIGPDNIAVNQIRLDKKTYHYLAAPFIDSFANNDANGLSNMSDALSKCWIISGEPAALIDDANDKIRKEGVEIKKQILITTLSISFFILVSTIIVMNLISRKIVYPISAAADMSEKIALGDLSYVLDESSTDETGKLSKSMNRMVKNL